MVAYLRMQISSLASRADEEHVDDDELLRFVSGALGQERARAIRAHVDACDDCRELLAIAGREAVSAGELGEPESAPIVPGVEIEGRFRIEREIGRGGMGVVYAAEHLSMHRRVALKVLSDEAGGDEESISRFIRETRVAAKLASPHAVRVYDVGRLATGAPYMVMELLDGRDLERVLADEGPIDVARAIAWTLQACDAIGEAHAAGIVHRDIKLTNIFLADLPPEPIVKVLDFGLAKGFAPGTGDGSLTRPGAFMGTPSYMSPEQLLSAKDVDARTDVWAFGVALYRLLTQTYPFEASNLAGLCARIAGGEAPPPPSARRAGVPRAVDEVVQRCLARSPDGRYPDAHALAEALAASLQFQERTTVRGGSRPEEAASATLPIAARPGPAPAPSSPEVRRAPPAPALPPPSTRDARARPVWPYVLLAAVASGAAVAAVFAGSRRAAPSAEPVASAPTANEAPPASVALVASAPLTSEASASAPRAAATASAPPPPATIKRAPPSRGGGRPAPSVAAPPASDRHYEKM